MEAGAILLRKKEGSGCGCSFASDDVRVGAGWRLARVTGVCLVAVEETRDAH